MADELERRKTTSSVHEAYGDSKPSFGSRFLENDDDVWQQNAWDHVPPPANQNEVIAASLAKQRSAPVPQEEKPKYNDRPSRHWDNFYKANSSNFFRDRKWLHLEFPELMAAAKPDAGPVIITELGCGAGNIAFPLLSANRNPKLTLRAHDYSTHAIKLVQQHPLYLSPPVGAVHASVWDLTSNSLPPGIEPASVDIAILVFVLSALHPDEWARAISNVHLMLRPGGLVLLRDYGRYDLTQLRFKRGRLLEDNFYIRGDKTRVYFFEPDELALLFTGSRLPQAQPRETENETVVQADLDTNAQADSLDESDGQDADLSANTSALLSIDVPPLPTIHPNLMAQANLQHPLFSISQLGIDRRLLVNRKRQLKMYRVWMQGKFVKI